MNIDQVTDNAGAHRFELASDGQTAFAAYTIDDDVITFTHTVVPSELEGRGIASQLIRHALGAAKARNLRVVPRCSFVAAYIDKHPQWASLLA